MTSSYLLSLKTIDDYTIPTNFSAYAENWKDCLEGFITIPVNNKCNNNKICVPVRGSTGRTYLNGPGSIDTSTWTNPNNRRFTKNLYGREEFGTSSPLCLPVMQECIPRTLYTPASQALFDRPLGPNREVNYHYEIGESPNCKSSPACIQCPNFTLTIGTTASTNNDWDYLMANDYFSSEQVRHDGTGYNLSNRASWPITAMVPINNKWNAYRITAADMNPTIKI